MVIFIVYITICHTLFNLYGIKVRILYGLTLGALFIRLDLWHKDRDFKDSLLNYPQKEKLWGYCRYVKGVLSLKLHVYERVTIFWKKH